MSSALFQCDRAEAPPGWDQETWDRKERINHVGAAAEVNLRLENRSHLLLPGLDARQADLIRIAAYLYAADQSVSRGGEADIYGLDWRRRMALAIPVNEPDFWGTPAVTNALSEVLNFLTDDQWRFHFTPLGSLERQLVFNLAERELHGNPDCIILFSGGADSLCATVNAISQGRTPLLVSHQPALVLESRQRQLIQELRERGAPWGLPQIGAVVHRYK
jgi:hypothetical protein